ncbi:N-acetylneuraminate synthase [Microvirga makkahensis]|uniref:N-acetylneuraminate synthase n=1 Tax=Microvirga makkahensis TaxID=1128670 RepID=UPI0031B6142C
MKTFFIAEIGVNHNGRLDLALKLVEAAYAAGAQAAKFQTFTADALAVPNTQTVAYQKAMSGALDQHAMLKSLELSEKDHRIIAQRCRELGIEFMSTAFDKRSMDMLCDIGIKRIKIPSGEITNLPYIKDCTRRGLPIILSTGMADLEEVRVAVGAVREVQRELSVPSPALTVLHCTSAYPAALEDVNLLAMQTMARELGVPIGYSDHTLGTFVSPIAVALGAVVIEKHITLDRTMPGPDHAASIEPDELKAMIAQIREVETLLGDGIKQARPAEYEARRLVRRGLKATRVIEAGTVLQESDIAILRPASGLAPGSYETVIGRRVVNSLDAGQPITQDDLEASEGLAR